MPELAVYGSIRARVHHWGLTTETIGLLLESLQQNGYDVDTAPTLGFYTLTKQAIQGFGIIQYDQTSLVLYGIGDSSYSHSHLDGTDER